MDESGVNQCLVRENGRAERGKKVEDQKRGKKFERMNVVGGLCNKKHIAIECYKQKMNSEYFERWFSEVLLEEVPRGGTVILDNASFHRKDALLKLIEKTRRKIGLLFLPAYSPDFNPIEKSWANMKRKLRDSLRDFNTVDAAIYNYFSVTVT